MKNTIWILLVLFLTNCGTKEQRLIPNFQETNLSFLHLRFGYDKTNNWVKRPENILMLHETFKHIGYNYLIDSSQWNNEGIWYINSKRSPRNLIDSLELTFHNQENSTVYFREFWNRRKSEGNDETVYHVIDEIKRIMNRNNTPDVDIGLVNDTLATLLSFEFPIRKINNSSAVNHLEYLIEIGLHKSAYNLVSGERYDYTEIDWGTINNDIFQKLVRSEKYQRPWFEDDTK